MTTVGPLGISHPVHGFRHGACGAVITVHDERPEDPRTCPQCGGRDLEPYDSPDLATRGGTYFFGPVIKARKTCKRCGGKSTAKVLARRPVGLCAKCEKLAMPASVEEPKLKGVT